jgi:acetoin utilization protein AcuC
LWAFSEIVPPLLERFQADLIVTQLGVDTHYSDPLAELSLTTRAYEKLYQKLSELSIPWLALGGGGYNLDVVPRAWTLAFGAMSGQNFDNHLPLNYKLKYGGEFLRDMMPPKLESERLRDRVEKMVEAVKTLHYL